MGGITRRVIVCVVTEASLFEMCLHWHVCVYSYILHTSKYDQYSLCIHAYTHTLNLANIHSVSMPRTLVQCSTAAPYGNQRTNVHLYRTCSPARTVLTPSFAPSHTTRKRSTSGRWSANKCSTGIPSPFFCGTAADSRSFVRRRWLFDSLDEDYMRELSVVGRVLCKHRGLLEFLCQACFANKPRIISTFNVSTGMCNNADFDHPDSEENRQLVGG